ncbi:MAG: response regulator transcription factor [Sphingobacteriales bacterium]|nr:response regulator transcription factor [Sphingobacteriales bacterium]OJW03547.1 MAG: DNA-binding response regulator [Sphingobacteriales bacterium 44-61]
MKKILCMIVDDEPLARDILQTYIARIPGWELKKSCINAVEAYEGLHQFTIDVIFLDIQMPVVTGIDFLRSLKKPPLVVFTTAYADHAVTGFELNAVDYLVKPIVFERFQQAIEKVNARLAVSEPVIKDPEQKQVQGADYFFIKQDSRLVKINYNEVLYMEAQRDYTYIYLKDRKILASMHLKALEELIQSLPLFRVQRSYIVNLDAIKAINGNVLEIAGKEIPIGASYKEELFRLLRV